MPHGVRGALLWLMFSSPTGMELLSLPQVNSSKVKACETALNSGQGQCSQKVEEKNSDF